MAQINIIVDTDTYTAPTFNPKPSTKYEPNYNPKISPTFTVPTHIPRTKPLSFFSYQLPTAATQTVWPVDYPIPLII